jgi:hypothetical protein
MSLHLVIDAEPVSVCRKGHPKAGPCCLICRRAYHSAYNRRRREAKWLAKYGVSRLPTTLERFMSKVDWSGGPQDCKVWTAAVTVDGYGQLGLNRSSVLAHRWFLGHLRGVPLARSEYALHHCDNPPCVNPAHLYVGDQRQNMHDCVTRGRYTNGRAGRTHCHRGHEYTEANTLMTKNKGRICRTCNRLNKQAARAHNTEDPQVPELAPMDVCDVCGDTTETAPLCKACDERQSRD